uniref:Tripartite motif-containing protein 65-like protein n=2 Tax=Callorhinchus milii TaxID=7868 RepID=A0A4W3GJP1_CALMI
DMTFSKPPPGLGLGLGLELGLELGPEPGPRCPAHGAALDLYCRDHRLGVCSACAATQHRGHDLAILGEEKTLQEKKLIARYEEMERQLKSTDRTIGEIKERVEAVKGSASQAKTNYVNKLGVLARALVEAGAEVTVLIEREERMALSQADGVLQKLEERQAGLSRSKQQLEATLRCSDALQIIQFSQETNTWKAMGEEPVWVPCDFALDTTLGGVTKALEAISKLIHKDLQGVSRQMERAEEIPGPEVAERCEAGPNRSLPIDLQIRGKFLHSYSQLTFDANTAHQSLTVSKAGRKVSHKEKQQCPAHPERFESEWQVLCSQGFAQGQHYWEMKLSDQWVFVGVAYKTIERKEESRIGKNGASWAVQLFSQSYSAWHNGHETKLSPAEYGRVGVFLDCTAGTVSFYGVTDTMTLIHRFDSVFVEPLYPALWVGDRVTVSLTQLK